MDLLLLWELCPTDIQQPQLLSVPWTWGCSRGILPWPGPARRHAVPKRSQQHSTDGIRGWNTPGRSGSDGCTFPGPLPLLLAPAQAPLPAEPSPAPALSPGPWQLRWRAREIREPGLSRKSEGRRWSRG